jgi:nucleoside-diphosphate-sugar epimerase
MSGLIAFVAGATGYVGREVVSRVTDTGGRAIAHVRPDSAHFDAWRERFDEIDTTAWDLGAMAARLVELAPTVVFALIGTTRKRARVEGIDGDRYDAVDYGLTELLYRAASEVPGRPRFVYLSAAGVSERSSSAYMKARWRAEELIRGGSLPYVIARPAIITGPDRDESRPGERFAAVTADAALAIAGALGAKTLRSRYRSTDATTLARALVRLALEPEGDAVIAEGDSLRTADG